MAARLTVVVCQGSSQGSAASDLEESLVAELMMKPGIDVTMIGELQRVDVSDTDFLCLSSFNHSFAVVSWMSADRVQEQWQRLGLAGQIVDYGAATEAAQTSGVTASESGGNRIFHLQLHPEIQLSQLMASLDSLLESRNVKTVSLGSLGSRPTAGDARRSEVKASESQSLPTAKMATPPAPTEFPPGNTQADEAYRHDARHDAPDDDAEDAELDRLVDDFDALDL